MNTDAIVAAIERLEAAILTGVPMDKRLWDATACAQYLGFSRAHFVKYIAPQPDFPKPHRVGTGGRGLRWKASEVMEWAESR